MKKNFFLFVTTFSAPGKNLEKLNFWKKLGTGLLGDLDHLMVQELIDKGPITRTFCLLSWLSSRPEQVGSSCSARRHSSPESSSGT